MMADMPLDASASSSNVLYAWIMFSAVYSTVRAFVLFAVGSSSATSAKWVARNVICILIGFFGFSSLVLPCL